MINTYDILFTKLLIRKEAFKPRVLLFIMTNAINSDSRKFSTFMSNYIKKFSAKFLNFC